MYWFCQISKWIHHRYTRVPILNPPPSLSPPHTIPLGRPSAPAPSIQYRALNLDWWLIPYMILYVFQCQSSCSGVHEWDFFKCTCMYVCVCLYWCSLEWCIFTGSECSSNSDNSDVCMQALMVCLYDFMWMAKTFSNLNFFTWEK